MKENKNLQSYFRIKDIRGKSTTKLKQSGINNPDLEFDLMLASILNTTREQIISMADVDEQTKSKLENMVDKRSKRYPLQYLTNNANFCGYSFYIEENCFIPRFETESLVEEATKTGFNEMLEICCGIGNISISIGLKMKDKSIFGSDNNLTALKVAKKNIARYKDKISQNGCSLIFFASNLFSSVKPTRQFDLIIANPPYIAPHDPNISEELRYEPYTALFADNNGYSVIESILLDCKHYLKSNSTLIIEFGYNQREYCEKTAENLGYRVKKIIIDEGGIKRGISLVLK